MIEALNRFDNLTAAGILARAALSLAYVAPPLSGTVADEEKVRAKVIAEARNQLGLDAENFDGETIEQIADYLDAESDKLMPPPDSASAFKRLAGRGELPSDLYTINVVQNVKDLYGKEYPLEKKIIQATIHAPNFEQHFGQDPNPEKPAMVSMFAKSFRTRWPLKNFIMLVGAQRQEGTTQLNVLQAYRIYPSRVDLSGANEPLEWLKRFTEVYGAEIEVNGVKAKFFNYAQITRPLETKAEVGAKGSGKPRQIIISDFTRWQDGREIATLIAAIDSDKYRATLDELGVRERDILEDFV